MSGGAAAGNTASSAAAGSAAGGSVGALSPAGFMAAAAAGNSSRRGSGSGAARSPLGQSGPYSRSSSGAAVGGAAPAGATAVFLDPQASTRSRDGSDGGSTSAKTPRNAGLPRAQSRSQWPSFMQRGISFFNRQASDASDDGGAQLPVTARPAANP